MWTTELEQRPEGGFNVRLYRDGASFATISADEWWMMSANVLLADMALRDEGLNFRAADVYDNSSTSTPTWTTDLVPSGDTFDVQLLCNDERVAVINLKDWAELPATEWIVQDTVEVALGLEQYGSDIDEVEENLKAAGDGEIL